MPTAVAANTFLLCVRHVSTSGVSSSDCVVLFLIMVLIDFGETSEFAANSVGRATVRRWLRRATAARGPDTSTLSFQIVGYHSKNWYGTTTPQRAVLHVSGKDTDVEAPL